MPKHTRYPEVTVGAVGFKESKILLVKRLKGPQKGTRAIPSGLVNLEETLQKVPKGRSKKRQD